MHLLIIYGKLFIYEKIQAKVTINVRGVIRECKPMNKKLKFSKAYQVVVFSRLENRLTIRCDDCNISHWKAKVI